MWVIVASILGTVICLSGSPAAAQDIYKSTNQRGAVTYSNIFTPGDKGVTVDFVDVEEARRSLNVYEWYQQSNIFRELDFGVIAFAVMRDEVTLCPSDMRLDRLQHKVEEKFERDRDGIGHRSLMKLMIDYATEAGCHRRSSIWLTVAKKPE